MNSRWLGLKQSESWTWCAVRRGPRAAVAEVIAHVAAPGPKLGLGVGELAEDFARRFADDVGQHIEAATVGHADDDVAHALAAGLFDGQVQQRHQGLAAFEREGLGAEEFLAQELLEDDGVGEPDQDAKLFLAGKRQAVLGAFHAALEPVPGGRVVQVHELDADGAAIGVAQALEDLADGQGLIIGQRGAAGEQVQVAVAEAVVAQLQLGRAWAAGAPSGSSSASMWPRTR